MISCIEIDLFLYRKKPQYRHTCFLRVVLNDSSCFRESCNESARTMPVEGRNFPHEERSLIGQPEGARAHLHLPESRYWGFFQYKKRSISIQDIIIYHYISCCYHYISLCIIFSIMIYHVSRRHMIYRYIIFFSPPCDIVRYHVNIMSRF